MFIDKENSKIPIKLQNTIFSLCLMQCVSGYPQCTLLFVVYNSYNYLIRELVLDE